ncbi:MAG: TRL-like family protein [Endomicrobia bacterium]|jgi:hypothetical protein|nr:TRL-like family protein [Endomicrobiia bacterium]
MRKLAFFLFFAVAVASFSGCMAPMSPVSGLIFMDVKAPLTATSNTKGKKVGKAEAKSYFGLVAMGDASIEAAAKAGGITKISSIDYESKTILGIISTFTTVVYGD